MSVKERREGGRKSEGREREEREREEREREERDVPTLYSLNHSSPAVPFYLVSVSI